MEFDFTSPQSPHDGSLDAIIQIGAGFNRRAAVTADFTAADLKIRDHAGQPVPLGDTVTIYGMYSGVGSSPLSGPIGFIDAEKITTP